MDIIDFIKDPERLAASKKFQDEEREKRGYLVNHDPARAKYMFGVNRERMVMDQFKAIESEPPSDELFARRLTLLNQLAEGLALQCKYEDAAQVAVDADMQAKYAQRAAAIRSLGVKRCLCPPVIVRPSRTDAKGEQVQTERTIDVMFNGEKVITISRCENCGLISAK